MVIGVNDVISKPYHSHTEYTARHLWIYINGERAIHFPPTVAIISVQRDKDSFQTWTPRCQDRPPEPASARK